MGIFSRIFGPNNSIFILLSWRQIRDDETKVGQMLEEVGLYYRFEKFQLDSNGRIPMGRAFVGIDSARRDIFHHFAPKLVERKIPFLLFLEPSRIGTNRLPLDEEVEILSRSLSLKEEERRKLESLRWEQPLEAEAAVQRLRTRLGRFPVEETVPTEYLETWGKLRLLSPTLASFGYRLDRNPHEENLPAVRKDMDFARTQLKTRLELAYAPEFEIGPALEIPALGRKKGPITKETPLHDIPIWDPLG